MTRRQTVIVAVAVVVVASTIIIAFGLTPRMRDFEVYWTGAVRAGAVESLYRIEDGHYQYKYLPAFAVLTIPLGWLSLPVAKGVWFAGSLALVVLLFILSVRLLPQQRKSSRLLYFAGFIVMGKFIVQELIHGQANILFAVVAVLALLALKRGHETTGGIWTAATAAIKPYGVILLPWLAARRRWESLLAATLGVGLIALLPITVYGISGNTELHQAWWKTVSSTTAPNLLSQVNVSLAAMFARWFSPGPLAVALALITAAGLVILVIAMFLKRRGILAPDGLEGAMLLMLIPLLSPQGWDYVLLIATPAVMYLANYSDQLPRLLRVVTVLAALLIGLSLFDVMGRTVYSVFMRSGITSVCAIFLIGALSALRFRRIA